MVPTTPMRKRMKRRETPDQVRFVTFSCFRRIALLSNPRIADLLEANLRAACERGEIELIAWVIMPEHVHLIVRPGPGCSLAETLLSLKLSVSKRVLPRWRAAGAPVLKHLSVGARFRFWQTGGGFDRNVRDEAELCREIRYVHDNPVERRLVARAEDWRWSSVRWWMGRREGELPCRYPRGTGWEHWKGYVTRERGI